MQVKIKDAANFRIKIISTEEHPVQGKISLGALSLIAGSTVSFT